MAEVPNQPPAPLPTAEEVAAHNAAIKAKLEGQHDPNLPNPGDQKVAGDALDNLLKQAEKKADVEPNVEPAPKPPGTVEPAAPDPAAVEAAKKAEAEKAARAEELKRADETVFKDAPKLPANASPKSSEAFESIKLRASQEISKLSAELEAVKAKLTQHESSAGKMTPEQEAVLKENQELKKWRAKLDVEFDPQFKNFDTEAEQSREFIYAQLRKGNVSDATIEKIKKFGGPDKVAMKPIFDALNDTVTQRLVESKLADIEMAKYKKEQAITAAKGNIDEYIKAREEETTKASTIGVEATKKELNEMWSKLEWTKQQTPKQGATAEEKTAVDNHNKFVDQMRKELDAAMADNSPKMKATLLTAVAQLFNLQTVHDTLKTAHDKVQAELKELREFKDKVKNSTRSRLPESQAPTSGLAPLQKPTSIFNTPAVDGLDAIAKQVMAERAAKGQA